MPAYRAPTVRERVPPRRVLTERASTAREMNRDNPACGEERIANELNPSSESVCRPALPHLEEPSPGPHLARSRLLNVFVAMEAGSRRILHHNVTSHPAAEWTIQHSVSSCTPITSTAASSTTATRSFRLNLISRTLT